MPIWEEAHGAGSICLVFTIVMVQLLLMTEHGNYSAQLDESQSVKEPTASPRIFLT